MGRVELADSSTRRESLRMSHWPLLPLDLDRAAGEPPPRDEPLRAAGEATAWLAGILLLVRLFGGGTAAPFAVPYAVVLWGGGAAMALCALLVVVALAAPLVAAAMPMPTGAAGMLLRLYDRAVHLALVLSACAATAAFAITAAPGSLPVLLFVGQAGLMWLLHRMRLAGATDGRGPRPRIRR